MPGPSQNSSTATANSSSRASRYILTNKDQIKLIWERSVRKKVPASEGKDSLVMMNSLGEFLDELILLLKQNGATDLPIAGSAMSKVHGGQRAHLSGYYLPQLLKEFSILRNVLLEELFANNLLSHTVLITINSAIDDIISGASTEFVRVQNEKLTEALKVAEASNQSLQHFAAIAAHDLKSPLATIYSHADLLIEDHESNLQRDALHSVNKIRNTSERMLNLIDRILEYAKIASTRKPFQVVSLSEAVSAAVQNLTDAIENSGTRFHQDKLPEVLGDLDLLTQLFQNLFANSIKFRGDKTPEITIRCTDAGKSWMISVSDTGIGFNQNKPVFELFTQLEGSSQNRDSGAGIGLATCKKVVEIHSGEIWAESTPGVGSTFSFLLPKIRELPDEIQTLQ